jgi:glycogen operon protein
MTIGYLAPHAQYSATGDQVREFKDGQGAAPRGIEAILDVVYNHTAEGNHSGRCSASGRRQPEPPAGPDNPRFYMDYTVPATRSTRCTRACSAIMDSLRYFVTECHVDGLRFDLASALAREFYDVDRLVVLRHHPPGSDPLPGRLIAEPWDVGPGGYQVGNFLILWSEWNGIYRDTMRDFWRGQSDVAACRALRRLGRLTRATGAAVRVDQSHHGARRVHVARPSRTTASTTRRTARAISDGPTTTARGTAALRTDRRSGRRAACRQQRNFLTTLLFRRAS